MAADVRVERFIPLFSRLEAQSRRCAPVSEPFSRRYRDRRGAEGRGDESNGASRDGKQMSDDSRQPGDREQMPKMKKRRIAETKWGDSGETAQNDLGPLLQFAGELVHKLLPERLERPADVILYGLRRDVHDLGDFFVRKPMTACLSPAPPPWV